MIICILLLTLNIKIDHISTSTRLMATTLGWRMSQADGPQLVKLPDRAITWPHEVTWQIKNDISPLIRGLWLLILRFIVHGHYPSSLLTLWACDQAITWLIKNVIFQLPREIWLPNFTKWWVLMPIIYKVTQPVNHVRSYNKWKTL